MIAQSTRSSLAASALIIGLAFSPLARAEKSTYQLDPDHTSVGFLVHHIGYAKVLGLFREVRGSYQFDEQSSELSALEIVIETDSVYTNHKKRDKHLRGADFLNSREFPNMTFSASTAKKTGDRTFVIAGQLDLLGITRPLTLTATWNKSATYPFDGNPYVMGVSARGTFFRSEHGMTYAVENGWVGDDVELIIEFEARRQ